MRTRDLLDSPSEQLPRTVTPISDETVASFARRLADANYLNAEAFRQLLTGGRRLTVPVPVDVLMTLSGHTELVLCCAMPELCTTQQLSTLPVAGRALPGVAREGLMCRACAAVCGATGSVRRWQTHEAVVCVRHRLWTAVGSTGPDAQLSLTEHPEIIAANLAHRRLIRRYGRPAVHCAYIDALRVCRGWHSSGLHLNQASTLIERFRGAGAQLDRDDPVIIAATYPQVVALTRLLASPYWRRLALSDHQQDGGWIDHDQLAQIDREITRLGQTASSEGLRLTHDAREHLREERILRFKPMAALFVDEVRRTVSPDYRWIPLPVSSRLDDLVSWVIDQIRPAFDPRRSHSRSQPPRAETL